MNYFIQFPPTKDEIAAVAKRDLDAQINEIKRKRAGVPGRKPLDGAFFTLRMAGVMNKSMVTYSHVTAQYESVNPIKSDIDSIISIINSILVHK